MLHNSLGSQLQEFKTTSGNASLTWCAFILNFVWPPPPASFYTCMTLTPTPQVCVRPDGLRRVAHGTCPKLHHCGCDPPRHGGLLWVPHLVRLEYTNERPLLGEHGTAIHYGYMAAGT